MERKHYVRINLELQLVEKARLLAKTRKCGRKGAMLFIQFTNLAPGFLQVSCKVLRVLVPLLSISVVIFS